MAAWCRDNVEIPLHKGTVFPHVCRGQFFPLTSDVSAMIRLCFLCVVLGCLLQTIPSFHAELPPIRLRPLLVLPVVCLVCLLQVRPTGFGGAANAKSDTMQMSYVIAATRQVLDVVASPSNIIFVLV